MRIGHGFDVHKITEGKGIRLGGVPIACDFSLLAHSDGDVLIHALCDALLGAAALGDIGHHFPDNDPQWKGVDSRELLQAVISLVSQQGYYLGNADITVIAERPRLSPHIETMRQTLTGVMDCEVGQVNIKATTTEGLGYCGRQEGIAAHAVVTLISRA